MASKPGIPDFEKPNHIAKLLVDDSKDVDHLSAIIFHFINEPEFFYEHLRDAILHMDCETCGNSHYICAIEELREMMFLLILKQKKSAA